MASKTLSALITLTAVSAASYAMAQAPAEYESGHGALQVFDADGRAASPLWVRIWVGFMLATFAAGLIFVWRHPIARWAVGGIVVSFFVTPFLFQALGLPYLSGAIAIGHLLFWSPALALLLLRRPFLKADEGRWFRIWSGTMTAVILFSFIFDIRDAAIYIAHFSG